MVLPSVLLGSDAFIYLVAMIAYLQDLFFSGGIELFYVLDASKIVVPLNLILSYLALETFLTHSAPHRYQLAFIYQMVPQLVRCVGSIFIDTFTALVRTFESDIANLALRGFQMFDVVFIFEGD